MKRITLFYVFVAFLGIQWITAQTKVITGMVTSAEDGSPLPGVSIVVEGTTLGTVSDADGKYQLEIPEGAKVLVFSFIGMKTIAYELGNQVRINITMEADISSNG